jgi:5'-nucleotidase
MHILLTNDDGIHAPGLQALERAVALLPDCQISIVAPATEQSMCAHRVNTHQPIQVEQIGSQRWAVEATPADCVRIALFALHLKPDWVLSGVNAGGNMGQDIVISGTFAGAREAAYHGIPAAAFSHYLIKDLPIDWERITAWTHRVFQTLCTEPLEDAEVWNINFPHLPPGDVAMPAMQRCQPARAPLNVSYEMLTPSEKTSVSHHRYTASYAQRPRHPGSDVDVCFSGSIAVSRLRL